MIKRSGMLAEKALERFMASHGFKTPALAHYFILTGDFTMLEPTGPAPDTG